MVQRGVQVLVDALTLAAVASQATVYVGDLEVRTRSLHWRVRGLRRRGWGLPQVWLTPDLWRFVSAGRMSPCPSPTHPSSVAMLSRSLASMKPRRAKRGNAL